jgi:hypothetical protein
MPIARRTPDPLASVTVSTGLAGLLKRARTRAARAGLPLVWLVASAALPLAAQAQSRGSAVTVGVTVQGGEIRVSTGNATLPAGVSTITWQLAPGDWRFAAGSIDFGDATGAFNCKVFSDGRTVSCNRGASAPRGQLPYRIRLSNGGAAVELPQPTIYISLE